MAFYWQFVSIFMALGYAWLIWKYRRAWQQIPEFVPSPSWTPQKRISVLIPARNEARHLPECIRSITGGTYPAHLLEIIVVDDFSAPDEDPRLFWTDLLCDCPATLTLLRLEDFLSPEARFTANKKKAIAWAVSAASGDIVVTTDADVVAPPEWLHQIAACFEAANARMVCAPVLFFREKNRFQRFQSLDFIAMAGIGASGLALGWHAVANGANLAYRRSLFAEMKGYDGNEHIASGDDMFLAQKVFDHHPDGVFYLKNRAAVVCTEPAPDLVSFWHQRLRWGAKNAAFPNWRLRLSLLLTGAFCGSILLNAGWLFCGGQLALTLGLQLLTKALADALFLSAICRFFNRSDLMRSFFSSFFLHIAYIGVMGGAGLFVKKYRWKGRQTS
ncbi:MAG: glycosyltransferase [Saprospiraceae bacterium]|nr:glycosyltransferase [Saprospiraceae bacterium]